MKQFYLFITVSILLACSQKIVAQILLQPTAQTAKKEIRCYTVEVINEFRKKHPNAETDAQFELSLSKKMQERKTQRTMLANYTIPVIFHIIHNGELPGTSSNLSAASISQQILQLNKDFANLSNSQYGVAGNTGLQFVLAQKNAGGTVLAEPGIDRIDRNTSSWTDYTTAGWTNTYIDATVKPASIWDATKYYNVWIIPNITNTISTLLGYSTFPTLSTLTGISSSETATTAGVVVATGTIGSSFTPNGCAKPYGLGKSLSHETGHFFGLRHIWGDTNCGDDFCGDTPVHFASNSGVPSHPKSNSCGTADEMFENYMDYSDDIVLNTFTNNQADRMQTVMLNSPRRISLASSPAGGVTTTASNKISFAYCSGTLTISETGNTGTYPRYKDVNIILNAEDKATGAATVTFAATGTAVNNFHYQILTPSVSFATGDNFKNVKIRVFDNTEVDGNKTIILNYTINGTGVAAGSSAQSLTITITDDDNIKIGSNTVSLLNQNFGTAGGAIPSGWGTGSFIPIAGLNVWAVGSNGGTGITGQALYITNDAVAKPLSYSVNEVTDAVVATPKVRITGYTNPTLSFTYKCNGEAGADYGQLMYSYNNSLFYFLTDATGNKYTYQGNAAAVNTGDLVLPDVLKDTAFTIAFRWINNDNTGNDPPFLIDNVLIAATPYPIETTISSSYGYDIRSGTATNNLKSSNNRVLVSLKNASTSVGGITAQLTQAGSGTTALVTLGGAFLRTQKVFQISPAVANTTATYQATLYFTEAELAVWGASKLTLKILKVKDGVSLASTLNTGNSELITPSVFEDATAGYIAYTGNFTGFSQFVLVSPTTVLPVTLTNFFAKPNQKNIQLSWTTEAEINNRGFMVERSLDGSNFNTIGFVTGNGNSSLVSKYNYRDNYVQPDMVYYYRLRQIDINNRQVYSNIRNARIGKGAGIELTVSPNPAKDYVNLFISGTTNKATVEIINASGQRIQQQNNISASNGVYKLLLKGVAKGNYNIVVHLPEGAYTARMIVE